MLHLGCFWAENHFFYWTAAQAAACVWLARFMTSVTSEKKNVLVKNSLKALGWVSVYTGTFTPAPTEPIWFRHRALALDGMWAPLRTSEDQAKC